MKKILIQISIGIIVFLLIDYLFGDLLFNSHFKKNVYERNKNYLYNFKKNLNVKNYNYGYKNYQLCTNEFGAIDSCNKQNPNKKKIDYVFIGDSFVEGLGIEFEDTFFGLLKERNTDSSFLNLGVSGYSPSIYYHKLKFFYEKGFKFSEVFVFLDTSDIFDEIYRYRENEKNELTFLLTNDEINNLLDKKKKIIKDIHSNFPGSFFLLSNIIKLLPNFDYLQNYYLNLMVNHSFGEWVNSEGNLYPKNKLNDSLKKNSVFVEKIVKIANENKSKITFVLYPWPGQLSKGELNNLYNRYWTDFFENKKINYINLNSTFFDMLKKYNSRDLIFKYYIPGDVHFNIIGHKLIFEIINNALIARR
jgi:hypothetical protein